MNDPAASGRGIRQGFLFKNRSQRDAGPNINVQWVYDFSGLVSEAGKSPSFPPRLAGRGMKPTGGNKNLKSLNSPKKLHGGDDMGRKGFCQIFLNRGLQQPVQERDLFFLLDDLRRTLDTCLGGKKINGVL